jgi:ABC-type lipoprotein export system ATPase subunit
MIECVNVVKSYNGEAVLSQVSLKVESGEFVSIMGESGSGKSTLINILGGFLSPDFGEV